MARSKKKGTLGLSPAVRTKLWAKLWTTAKARTSTISNFLKAGAYAAPASARADLECLLHHATHLQPPTRPKSLASHERALKHLRELIDVIDKGHDSFWNKYFEARQVEAATDLDFEIGANRRSVLALSDILARKEGSTSTEIFHDSLDEDPAPDDSHVEGPALGDGGPRSFQEYITVSSPLPRVAADCPSPCIVEERPLPIALSLLLEDYPGAAELDFIDCRPTANPVFCSISQKTRVKYAEYLGNTVDHLVKEETHAYLVGIFGSQRTSEEWVKFIDDMRIPDDPQLAAVARTIRQTLPAFIKAFSLGPLNPLLGADTLENVHLNLFIHPIFEKLLWETARVVYTFGEMTSPFVEKGKADGIGIILDADKFPLVYVEGSRPVSMKGKEGDDATKIAGALADIRARTLQNITRHRRRLPALFATFGAQSINTHVRLVGSLHPPGPMRTVNDSSYELAAVSPTGRGSEETHVLPLSVSDHVCDTPTVTILLPPPAPPSSTSNKMLYLEGLRGLAAWGVANTHLSISYLVGSSWLMHQIRYLCTFYGLAVAIFFVLSGRVLVVGFLKRRDPAILSSAAVRRPFRLGLPMMATLLIQIVLYNIGWGHYAKNEDHPDYHSVFRWLWAIPRYFIYGTSWPYPIFVQWTINIELWNSYYVYLYVLVVAFLPRNRFLFHAIVIFLCYWLRLWTVLFFFGVLLSDLIQEGHMRALMTGSRRRLYIIRGVLLLLVILLRIEDPNHKAYKWFNMWQPNHVGGNIEENENWEFWRSSPIVSLASMAFVLLLELTPLAQKFFSLRPFVFLGEISFMLYLIHPLVYHALGPSVHEFVMSLEVGGLPSMVSIYMILMSTVIAVSYVLYRVVDLPSVRLTKWIDRSLFGKSSPSATRSGLRQWISGLRRRRFVVPTPAEWACAEEQKSWEEYVALLDAIEASIMEGDRARRLAVIDAYLDKAEEYYQFILRSMDEGHTPAERAATMMRRCPSLNGCERWSKTS
ncbi:hypothetical protein HDU85_004035 [Gaertneriomyces sp. JEL0708]|nr:hypothetical protein HDU85_004035 [Gaertneriomyces sp. JEL0708]